MSILARTIAHTVPTKKMYAIKLPSHLPKLPEQIAQTLNEIYPQDTPRAVIISEDIDPQRRADSHSGQSSLSPTHTDLRDS